MKKAICLLLITMFLCMGMMNVVATHVVDDNDNIVERHSPFYVGSKPFEEYEEPGFVCGFYNRIEWTSHSNNTNVRYLYSPHLLFGWDFEYRDPSHPLPWSLQIAAFSSRVLFQAFKTTFVGFFTGTEPGFICGFVDGNCYFTYGFYPPEATN